jgi:hypothetical protein
MEIIELKGFLFEKSKSSESRFRGFNFLYAETSHNQKYKEDGFSDETIKWINQTCIELSEKLNATIENIERDKINNEISVLNSILKKEILINWLGCVDNVLNAQSQYIKALTKSKKPIKYLIISEAPPLSIQDNKLFSNYVFLNNDNTKDIYRTVPFDAIRNIENDNESSLNEKCKGDDLIKFYSKYRVAFLDIIPIPLPTIATNLRKHWCTDLFYSIDGKTPRIIQFLNLSIIEFINKLGGVTFDTDLKIAFMAPTTISENIVKWLTIKTFDKTTASEFLSIFPKRLHNKNYDELKDLIGVDGSHNPNKEKLMKAFEL